MFRIVVNQLNSLKEKLEKEQEKFNAALKSNDTATLQTTGGVMPNPVYDQLSLRLFDFDSEIASS